MLGSVLHDLVESGLVFRTGAGATTLYRATDEADLALVHPAGDGAESLVPPEVPSAPAAEETPDAP